MWVDTRSVHSDNPGWRDMVSSCFHEWLGTFMIAVRRPCLAMHLQKPYPQKLGQGAFDSRAAFIARRAFVTPTPGAGRLERLLLCLGWQPETTPLLLRLGTERARGAGTTLLRAEGNDNVG